MAATATKNHDYHLVNPSPWPALGSLSAFVLAVGGIIFMRTRTSDAPDPWIMLIGFVGVFYTMYAWWHDVIRESLEGDHTRVVQISHRYGMMLFITSEVMFFVAWFWAYFDGFFRHSDPVQFARAAATGGTWPPAGIEPMNPWHLPLFNTLLLLCSATTVTWAHHALLQNDRQGLKWGLVLTILLGIGFTTCQAIEYSHAGFAYSGNIYGATFFMATGFHGFHVIVGTIFLIVCLARAQMGQFTPTKHLGFEFAAWYWHFVDVVWLFLFSCIYVWGSWGAALPPG